MSADTPETPSGQKSDQPTTPPAYQAPVYNQPQAYGQAPYNNPTGYGQAPVQDPGKTMAIVSIILPFVGFSLVGLILAIVAKVKSKKAGFNNTLALVSIIVNAVIILASIIATIVAIVFFVNFAQEISDACSNGQPSVTIGDQVVACPSVTP